MLFCTSVEATKIDPEAFVKAMERAPITPTQLASAVGVSLSYIGDIRKGRRNLARNPALRLELAKAIGVPVHWIEQQAAAA